MRRDLGGGVFSEEWGSPGHPQRAPPLPCEALWSTGHRWYISAMVKTTATLHHRLTEHPTDAEHFMQTVFSLTHIKSQWFRNCVHAQSLSGVQLFVTLWTVTHLAPLSTGFPKQVHYSGLPFPPPRVSSQPRDWTQVSCTGRRILYHWATWEVLMQELPSPFFQMMKSRFKEIITCPRYTQKKYWGYFN